MPATITLKGIWAAIIAAGFAILLALLAVQTVRIEGFKVWPISVEGLKAKAERYQAAERAAQAAYRAEVARRNAIATDYEREASNAAQVATIREREIRTIYRDIPVPTECAVPDDARRVLAEAVAASNASATGEPVRAVPATPDATQSAD